MTRRVQSWLAIFSTSVLVVALNACQKLDKGYPMQPQHADAATVPTEFLSVKPVCFGRFLVDVPLNAEVVYGPAEFDGTVHVFEEMAGSLNELVAREVADVEGERYVLGTRKDDLPRYGEVISGPLPGQRTVIGAPDFATYTATSFVTKEPHLFILSAGGSADEKPLLALVNRTAASLRVRKPDEIPYEPGFCVDGGFIPLTAEFENIKMGIRFKRFPDVHFSNRASKNQEFLPQGGMLEERMASALEDALPKQRLWFNKISYLRRGERTLLTWKGEEVLARLPAQEGAKESHQFHFKSVGEIHDPMRPELDVELISGAKENERGAVTPSLNDAQMLALWDTLTATIRPRPITPPAPPPVHKKVALGS